MRVKFHKNDANNMIFLADRWKWLLSNAILLYILNLLYCSSKKMH